jgi:hypothetical protein
VLRFVAVRIERFLSIEIDDALNNTIQYEEDLLLCLLDNASISVFIVEFDRSQVYALYDTRQTVREKRNASISSIGIGMYSVVYRNWNACLEHTSLTI